MQYLTININTTNNTDQVMILSTVVKTESDLRIDHNSKCLFLGSCFTQNISDKAVYYGFNVCHPFGAIYNPASVLKCLNILKNRTLVSETDLIPDRHLFSHYDFHSKYSDTDKAEAVKKMNNAVCTGNSFFNEADYIIITFGTTGIYRLKSSGMVVANCHHTDQKEFTREILPIDWITDNYSDFVRQFPNKRFIFTVSPIRYRKDGYHQSKLSKAALLIAIDRICSQNANCSYFPSYEIMDDELRDYRFYAADMIHPSTVAIDYIWEKFADTYFTEETKLKCKEFEDVRKLENHLTLVP